MPSIGTSVSQVLPRVGYFRAMDINDNSGYYYTFPTVPHDGDAVTILDAEGTSSNRMNIGDIYRDMGKRITLLSDNGLVSVVLNRVQLVNGPSFEGVPQDTNDDRYVIVFSADPGSYPVGVARTG